MIKKYHFFINAFIDKQSVILSRNEMKYYRLKRPLVNV